MNGRYHKKDLLAKNGEHIDDYGNIRWYKDGMVHRDNDLPACIYNNGELRWVQNDLIHRDNDLPAIIYKGGAKEWYQRGNLHRLIGPAYEDPGGHQEWWVNGEQIECSSNEEFLRLIKLRYLW